MPRSSPRLSHRLRPVAVLAARALALVAASTAAGFAINAARPDGLRFATFEPPVACTGSGENDHGSPPPAPPPAPRFINPIRASSMCGREDVVVLDARPAKRFAEGHVVGAVHLPCDAGDLVADTAIAGLDKATLVIVYGEQTEDAEPVATTLQRRLPPGKRMAVLEGGFAAWNAANLSCVSGPCQECGVASSSHSDAEALPQPRARE